MSGALPSTRSPGSGLATRTVWYRRHRLKILVAVAIGILVLALMVMRMGPANEKPDQTMPASSLTAHYAPPAADAPPLVRETPLPPQPRPAPAASPIPTPLPALPAKITIVSTTFHRQAGIPEYMKPKPAPAGPAAPDPTSGIAYKPETFDGTTAFVLKHPELVLPQWASIPCTLETGVITGVEGVTPFRCRTSKDVTSDDGVVLMEKGTIIGGTYSSRVSDGQFRVVAVAANARTPNKVVVPLGGPMADQIGQPGVEGDVNEHWWRRLGGALILSMLDAGISVGQSAMQSNSNGTSINVGSSINAGGPFSQVTNSLLQKQMSIPATVTLAQGSKVTLWTTRWVSFEKVYRLEGGAR